MIIREAVRQADPAGIDTVAERIRRDLGKAAGRIKEGALLYVQEEQHYGKPRNRRKK